MEAGRATAARAVLQKNMHTILLLILHLPLTLSTLSSHLEQGPHAPPTESLMKEAQHGQPRVCERAAPPPGATPATAACHNGVHLGGPKGELIRCKDQSRAEQELE